MAVRLFQVSQFGVWLMYQVASSEFIILVSEFVLFPLHLDHTVILQYDRQLRDQVVQVVKNVQAAQNE
ncbi:hypothetical protein FGO68_gene15504 [Halteria grandinella]|uniref:Uncharacterized protein n=1 Tax=Halteria grandinella TaxID=5974 RepID=A0A8J8NGX8_HALGN|nr:hypothetical protein FGO68_gene15504 [Halteria grandinella]